MIDAGGQPELVRMPAEGHLVTQVAGPFATATGRASSGRSVKGPWVNLEQNSGRVLDVAAEKCDCGHGIAAERRVE